MLGGGKKSTTELADVLQLDQIDLLFMGQNLEKKDVMLSLTALPHRCHLVHIHGGSMVHLLPILQSLQLGLCFIT